MLTVGILGAAGIAPSSMIRPALRREDVEVVAVASRTSAAEYARAHGIGRAHGSYEALVADDEVELVYNALPPSLHAEWTIAALEAGKHVLCEKPSAMDQVEAARVVAAARASGRRVVEAFHDHYHPFSARVRELVASGQLGRLLGVDVRFTGATPFDARSIRHDPQLGGGALMDLGCYPVRWLRSLSATQPVVTSARAALNPLGADLVIDAELELADGVPASLHASMAEGVPLSSTITVRGERGRLVADNVVFPSKGHSLLWELDGVARESTVAGETTYDHQLAAVVDALATGRELPTEGADLPATMAVVDAVYAAAGVARPGR